MGKKFSELERTSSLNNGDLFAVAQVDAQARTGYKSKSTETSAVAQKLLKGIEFPTDLQTDDKTVLGSINEVNSRTIVYDVVSGPIANFKTSPELPIKSLGIDVNAVQEAGTPTPDAPLPISGRSEIDLVHCGKNLFDKDTTPIVNGYIDMSAFNTTNSKARTTYIKIPSGCTITVSKIQSERFTIATAKSIPANGVAFTNRASRTTATNLTLTAGSQDHYLWIWFYLEDTDTIPFETVLNSLQVEASSSASTFEPYNGTTEVIELGDTYYGGHFTQDKEGHRSFVVEKIGKKINEFEGWYYISGFTYFECVVGNMKGSASTSVLNGLICECYTTRTSQQAGSGNIDDSIAGWTYTSTNESRLRIKDNDFNNVSDWLNSVGNYLVIYPLATPIVIDLPDGDPIITLNGTNNIYADSGDASVEYALTIKDYIDKQIASVQALILNS